MNKHRVRAACTALLAVAIAALSLTGTATAKLTGPYAKFAQCPYQETKANEEVIRCIDSVTNSGEVVLGAKAVPIEKQVVLQGGFEPREGEFSKFVGATNGVTLTPVPQNVPGGLSGLINCKKISNFLLRIACEATLEKGFTGLNATLELARPASEIRISEPHLAEGEGVALKLPVRVHLENPFLGGECYVGSSSTPIWWELTDGKTNPPGPNKSITGSGGEAEFLEEGRIIEIKNNVLVDNAWAAPGATGCGGAIVELLLDPIVNLAAELPATAGHNTAILKNTVNVASRFAVQRNDEENP